MIAWGLLPRCSVLTTLLITLAAPPAHAFCGTFVGQAGANLYNNASQVVVTRQGHDTTLTLANDFEGDPGDFALVIPVPALLGPDDVSVIDPDVITRVGDYSAPRLVRYTCDDFRWDSSVSSSSDADGGGSGDPAAGSVTVEASFSAGEYDLVVLSAEQSGDLLSWLGTHGYSVPQAAADMLQEYIDSGTYFLAAKVDPDDVPETQAWLRPLQLRYASQALSLPIRLGTLNSPGVQDLLIYVINDQEEGGAGISNYSQAEVEHECMVDLADGGAGGDFAVFWDEAFDAPRVDSPGALWTQEYTWAPAWCDPCAGDPLTDEDVQALGFDGTAWDAFFTRLHLRYEPTQAKQDVVLYTSGDETRTQIRYILYDPALEDRYPLCQTGWADDPGSCDADPTDTLPEPTETDDDGTAGGRFGCSVSARPGMMAAVLALCVLVGRRRD